MARTILFTFILLLSQNISAGDWEIMNKGLPGSLNSIDFIDDQTGWLAGNSIGLLKSIDGGLNWYHLPSDENIQYNKIDFISPTLGWAVGWMLEPAKSVILKTLDGGYSWQVKYESFETTISSIIATDGITAYALGYPALILKTSDGGDNWSNIASGLDNVNYQSMWFFNSQSGVIVGNYSNNNEYGSLILRTMDGGMNWLEHRYSDLLYMSNLKFVSNAIGYCIAQNDSGQVLFCQTSDTSKTWTIQSKRNNYIFDYWACSEDTVYAITSELISIVMNQIVERSIDSGRHWEKVGSLSNWMYNTIYFHKSSGYILGMIGGGFGEIRSGGVLFRSTDNGEQWKIPILSYPFSVLYFIDKTNGFIAGGANELHFMAGDVFVTNDSGKNLSLNFSPGGLVSACQFLNTDLGYLLSSQGFGGSTIYKTEDGAEHWTMIYKDNYDSTGFSFNGSDLSFINENTGWAVGNYWDSAANKSVILGTGDGGKTWKIEWEHTYPESQNYNLNSIHFADEQTGWAVGESGLIVKYNLQGNWEKMKSSTELPLLKVFFTNPNDGWISGGYYDYQTEIKSILLKTSNGGQTWESQTPANRLIEDIYFKNHLKGWAVGFDKLFQGFILATTDGGLNWQIQLDSLDVPLRSIYFRDGYGWAAGDLGTILRTEDGSSWIEEKFKDIPIHDLYLAPNFPNPFNSITTISYQLPIAGPVELSIYNLSGQKVATLVSRRQQAGQYKVTWNAAGFASGVYFYRLHSGEFKETKKLMLLR